MVTTIAVQPPAQVQRQTVLYPPLVIVCNTDEYDFFQIQLLDNYHEVIVDQHDVLQGTPTAVPQTLDNTRNRTPRAYAVFPNIVISRSGAYAIQINGFRMDYEADPPCMVHAVQMISRNVRVRTSSITQQLPSNTEARLLEILAQNGLV